MDLIKSRDRVSEHGEVFTPTWLVDVMFDQVREESMRIDSRILESACGSGKFLESALQRKLHTVKERYGNNSFEYQQNSLLALMCIYGIEKLPDNAEECKNNLVEIMRLSHPKITHKDDFILACEYVLSINIIEGNAITLKTNDGNPIIFAEWAYLGKGKFQRRDFLLHTIQKNSSVKSKKSLFSYSDMGEVYEPIRTYQIININSLAKLQFLGEVMP